MIVLFDDDFAVWKATRLPAALIEANSRRVDHVNGMAAFTAHDGLLALGEDLATRLQAAARAIETGRAKSTPERAVIGPRAGSGS